jgi:glycosyltransferase involved in cell wall biosynthesis
MSQNLKVSICMITYGHEKYIRQAIEGILMQKCDFEIELIISNDSSPDSTHTIIQNIFENHPKKECIKYFGHDKNLGMMPNFIFGLEQCSGKYIGVCEGDDYWTDPLKLQKQVDFLEANPDYVICYHKVKVLQNGILKEDTITQEVPETTTIKDLAKGNYIHTCSVVFKNNLFEKFPEYFLKSPVGDYFLHMLNARYGKIKFLDEYMGVYRLHETSVWSSKTQIKREQIWREFLTNIRKNFDKEVQEILDNQLKQYKISHKKRRIASIKKFIKRFLFFKRNK